MATCDACNQSVALAHSCSHCHGSFCDEHRFPQSHDCSAQVNPRPVGQKEYVDRGDGIDAPDPMDATTAKTASAPTDGGGDSTPDLNPDGSLARTQDQVWDDDELSDSTVQALSWEAVWIRIRSVLSSVPRLLALALVLLGAYNMILLPIVEVDVFTAYRGLGVIFGDRQTLPVFLGDVALITVGSIGVWIFSR